MAVPVQSGRVWAYVEREGERMSKLSIGGYGNPGRVITIARQVGGRVILLADGALDAAGQTGAALEIGRVSVEHQGVDFRFAEFAGQPIGRSPEEATQIGSAFAARLVASYPAIRVWQLSNEGQGDQSPEWFRLLAAFELAGTRELHRLGRQSCVLNLGVGCGQPEDYAGVFGDLLAEADLLGLHAYGSPERQLMQGGDAIWYALRYRQVVAVMQALGKRCPPIVLTECTTYDPWRGKYASSTIANDLVWLGTQMGHDNYVMGACGFQAGHPDPVRWSGFDLDDSAILDVMARWNAAHPAEAWTEAVARPAPVVPPPSPPQGGETLTYTTIGNDFRIVDRRSEVRRIGQYARRDLNLVKHIAIHHVGVSGDCTAKAIADYHVINNDYPGPGYHVIIRADGTPELMNDLDRACYNVAYKNAEVIGVVIAGDFSSEPPSQVQLDSTRRVVAELQYSCGWHVPAAGHRDIADPRSPTRCPGDTFPAWKSAVEVLPPVPGQPVPELRYVLGFAELAARLGVDVVGAPTEPETRISLMRQRTEAGVMLYQDGEQPAFYRAV